MHLQHDSFVWLVTKFLHTVSYVAFVNFETKIAIIITTTKNLQLIVNDCDYYCSRKL